MVEKIIVSPSDVRGLGDIVSPKSTSDFVLSDAEISSATESVNNMNLTVYHLQMSSLGILAVGVSPSSVTVGGGVTVTATVTDRLGEPLEDVPVVISCGSYSFDATDTDSNGQVVKSYTTTSSDVGSMVVTAASEGYTTATSYVSVNKHVSDLSMSIADSSVDVGQTFALSGTLKIDNTGTSGLNVDIYQDGTKIDTVTTGSGGAWSASVYAVTVGTTVFKAVYEGSSVNASDETSEYTCTVSLNSTNLNITVPALVYSDEFDVSGVLTDNASTPNPISNASVKLKWEVGGVQYESAAQTTNSSGQVTFHRDAPTAITTYKFWLEFSGTSVYGPSTSSEVNRTVGKETTVLSVSSPANAASFDSGDSVTVSGTLLTNDSEKLPSGTSITIKEGTTTLGTASVSTSDGSFSTTISGLSDGSHTLTIEYEESTNYLGSSVTRTVTLVPDASVSTVTLASNKGILSYADSESATLTATALTSQNVGVPGQSVMFYTGSPILATQCNDSGDWTTVMGTPVFSDDGVTLSNVDVIAYSTDIFDLGTESYRIYLTATKDSNSTEYLWLEILTENYGGNGTMVKINDSTITFLESSGISTPSGLGDTIDVCIEFTPTAQKLYINGSQVATGSMDYSSGSYDLQNYLILATDSNETCTLTNLGVYDSVVDEFIASDITDSNGEATATYQSEGVGDIEFTAQCGNILSGSYTITDYWKYGIKSTDTWHSINSSSSMTVVDGEATGYNQLLDFSIPMSSDFEIIVDYKVSTAQTGGLIFADVTNTSNFDYNRYAILVSSANQWSFQARSGSDVAFNKTLNTSISYNTYYTFKLVKQGTTISAYVGDTLIGSDTECGVIDDICVGLYRWGNSTQSIKNLKIKQL